MLSILITLLTRDSLRSQVTSTLRKSNDRAHAPRRSTARSPSPSASPSWSAWSRSGLWLWMASANGKGRSWARIVATVLGALSVLSLLSSVAQGQMTDAQPGRRAWSASRSPIAILVLLWRKESSAYYEAVKAQQRV